MKGANVRLSNNKAVDGENIPFCIFNFVFGLILFVFSLLSFIYGFGQEIKGVSNSWGLEMLETKEDEA